MKTQKLLFTLFTLLIFSLTWVSCSDEKEVHAAGGDDLLVGEWELVGVTEEGDLSAGSGWNYGNLTIRADGSAILMNVFPIEGRWHRVENTLHFQYEDSGETLGISFQIMELTETHLRLYTFTSAEEQGTYFGVYLDFERTSGLPSGPTLSDDLLVGHWKFYEMVYGDGEFGDFIINADGTYTALFDSKHLSGTWEHTQTVPTYPYSFIIYYEEGGETQSLEFKISVLDEIELRLTGINASSKYYNTYISYERVFE